MVVFFYILFFLTFLAAAVINADELKQLVRRLRDSDSAAFKAIYDLFYPAIYRFLQFKLNDDEVARDIIQDVFIKIWENRGQLDENRSFKSYLYKVAGNQALKHFRHEKVVRKHEQEEQIRSHEVESPHTQLEKKELSERLQSAIRQLPEKPRTVYLMSRVENLSYKEIAERLDISIKTVESHIGNSLKTLRRLLASG